jgi:hypothetical protein
MQPDRCCMSLFPGHRSQRAAACNQAIPLPYGDAADGKELFEKLLLGEQNQLSHDETLPFFQKLANAGLAWRSIGAVRRTASMLIRDGQIPQDIGSERSPLNPAHS